MSKSYPDRSRSSVLVVGGSGAIGSAIVSRLEENGREVIVLDRKAPASGNTPSQEADITSEASVDAALTSIVARFGVPDSLIFAAGYLSGSPFLEMTSREIEAHLDVNLYGAFHVAQRMAELMIGRGGKILFISSIHGKVGVPNRGAYAISKAALGAMARAMAVELAPHKIRVNVLAPGAVNAGMGPDPKARGFWQSETPARRIAEAEEVARFAAMLTSDDASFLTGQTIALDGGASNLRLQRDIDAESIS